MTTAPTARRSLRSTIPSGALPVVSGLVIAGVTAYGFLVISARALGPQRYSSLSVLWALVVLVGPGVFLPIEQEVARALSSRAAQGTGGGPVIRSAATVGVLLATVLFVATVAGSGFLLDRLFSEEFLLLIGLVLAFFGYWGTHLLRGALSGNDRFRPYGALVATEGVARLIFCGIFAVTGVATAGPYGLALGLAPIAAVVLIAPRERGLTAPGPPAPWGETFSALGYLLVGSALAQLLLNAGPIAVQLLASPGEEAAAGRFLAGLVMARIPLFLFQAVQASLLPKLSGLLGADRLRDFRTGLVRLVGVVVVTVIIAVAGALTVGPWVLTVLFGPDFELGREDLGYLAAASGAFMLALTYAQALIALSAFKAQIGGWAVGVTVFGLTLLAKGDLLFRVELAFLSGTGAAAAALGVLAHAILRHRSPPPEAVMEVVAPEMMEP